MALGCRACHPDEVRIDGQPSPGRRECACLLHCGARACTGAVASSTAQVIPVQPKERDGNRSHLYLTMHEAAAMAGMSLTDLRDLSATGLAPRRHTYGGMPVMLRTEMEQWVASWSEQPVGGEVR